MVQTFIRLIRARQAGTTLACLALSWTLWSEPAADDKFEILGVEATQIRYVFTLDNQGQIVCRAEQIDGSSPAGALGSPLRAPQPGTAIKTQGLEPAEITVNYTGFTPEAQNAFQRAVDTWSQLISSPIPIRVDASFGPLEEDVLGQAGPATSLLLGPGPPPIFFAISLARSILGNNVFPEFVDIVATFNSDFPDFYFGTDGNPPDGKLDFVGVVIHELGHGLGFSDSFRSEAGVGEWGNDTAPPNPACPCQRIFDLSVRTGNPGFLTDLDQFANPSSELGDALVSNHLFFSGALARQAFQASPPALYAPNPFEPGSSIAHLDEFAFPSGSPESIMTPSIFGGERHWCMNRRKRAR